MICKVKKIDGRPADRVTPLSSAPGRRQAVPRRRYGPKVKMDGGCYARNPSWGGGTPKVRMYGGCYTMYTMSPSWGGGTPG